MHQSSDPRETGSKAWQESQAGRGHGGAPEPLLPHSSQGLKGVVAWGTKLGQG